jgi:hypothetical protein
MVIDDKEDKDKAEKMTQEIDISSRAEMRVGIFVGYDNHGFNSPYRVWDTRKVVRDMTFDEDILGIPACNEILDDFTITFFKACKTNCSCHCGR